MPYVTTGLSSSDLALEKAYKFACDNCRGEVIPRPNAAGHMIGQDVAVIYPHIVRVVKVLLRANLRELATWYLMAGPPPLDVSGTGNTHSMLIKKGLNKKDADGVRWLQDRAQINPVVHVTNKNVRLVRLAEAIERLETLNSKYSKAVQGEMQEAQIRLPSTGDAGTVRVPVENILQENIQRYANTLQCMGAEGQRELEGLYLKAVKGSEAIIRKLRPITPAVESPSKKESFAAAARKPTGLEDLSVEQLREMEKALYYHGSPALCTAVLRVKQNKLDALASQPATPGKATPR